MLPACTINIGPREGPSPTPSPAPPPAAAQAPSTATGSPPVTEAIGSGNVVSEPRPVAGVNLVRLRGSGNLVVEQTGAESLTIEAEDNILPLLRSDVENGVLILGLRPGVGIVTHQPIVFKLTVKQLTGLDASGSGSIVVTGIDTDRFGLEGSGSIEVEVAGRAQEQDVSISGSGRYNGEALTSRSARVTVSGSADVVVNASDALDVQVSGSGNVRYVGNPSITEKVSGSGSVGRK
jgi:Putative auto-transporter adhesin, head GIN domain